MKGGGHRAIRGMAARLVLGSAVHGLIGASRRLISTSSRGPDGNAGARGEARQAPREVARELTSATTARPRPLVRAAIRPSALVRRSGDAPPGMAVAVDGVRRLAARIAPSARASWRLPAGRRTGRVREKAGGGGLPGAHRD
eukprot:10141676-Alexandrium_andersonii.AAC.1